MKYISIPVFILSFAIGILFVYLSEASKKEIVVYPTPNNKGIFQYKDSVFNCFDFSIKKTKCPSNTNDIKVISIQE